MGEGGEPVGEPGEGHPAADMLPESSFPPAPQILRNPPPTRTIRPTRRRSPARPIRNPPTSVPKPEKTRPRLYLIDGYALIYRAFFA
jgi:hypothetical protein